ncbi:DNA-binding storekeeper protein-related transcriptional regulator [Rhynchospora pubera]|uniref:DNA-binding storekeeper protein-related transcriptional regulator n=1 Tax=Rhynchospora pubera TaxID=906938 RepID=A0AAV8E674_9POAL|nr:DNA-binding storekeeper protein-related transcriptional regulator [Rhynchospora pubera]
MAEEEKQRMIDDDDDDGKESDTETEGEELDGEESEADETAGPSKGHEIAGAGPTVSGSTNPIAANSNKDGEGNGNGNGNGKVEVVEPVSSLSLSLGESKKGERDDPTAASRRLFQRLWTDEEEIRILRGFLEFTRRRGTTFASHQYDTGPFYEEIRQQLHLDFSKNQLIEKLRRLKKKYRNCATRMRSKGPSFSFRSPHEQAIFEIARHIWRPANKRQAQGLPDASHVDLDLAVDHASASAPSDELEFSFSFSSLPPSSTAAHPDFHLEADGAKPHSRSSGRRSRRRTQQDAFPPPPPPPVPTVPAGITAAIPVSISPPTHHEVATAVAAAAAAATPVPAPVVPSSSSGAAVEETIRSCLSPLFKELISSTVGGGASSLGLLTLGPMPTCPPGKSGDEKWRRQHILELEVYLQRIELVKEQVMQALQDLKGSAT